MQQEYKVFGQRWTNLLIFTLVTFGAGMGFLAMAPLLDIMAERWTVGFGGSWLLTALAAVDIVVLTLFVPEPEVCHGPPEGPPGGAPD